MKIIQLALLPIIIFAMTACVNVENEDAKIKVSPTGVSVENEDVKTEVGNTELPINIQYEGEGESLEIREGVINFEDEEDKAQFKDGVLNFEDSSDSVEIDFETGTIKVQEKK